MSDQPAPAAPVVPPEPTKKKSAGTVIAVAAGCLVALVFVVGILAAIAIPSMMRYQCRSKQMEAKVLLKSLAVAENSYQGEHNAYSRDANAIGFSASEARRYEIHILDATPTSFRAEARGVKDMDGDLWQVDQTGAPKNVASTKCKAD